MVENVTITEDDNIQENVNIKIHFVLQRYHSEAPVVESNKYINSILYKNCTKKVQF